MTRFLTTVAVLALCVAPMTAQSQEGQYNSTASLLINGGGGIGYVIVLMSVVGFALMIEAAITISRKKLAPPEIIDQLRSHLENKDFQAAFDLCEQNPGYVTNVMHAALPKVDHGFEKMEEAAGGVAEEEAIKLHSKISYMSLLGSVSPLLGLYGTVWGMMMAFETIEKQASPKPSELALGIKIALVTTFQGLSVAIPLNVGFFFFRNRVVSLVLEMGALIEDLLEPFRPAPGQG
ncbi:MAG TPA: MotA/TolQ/ExbB proton channel family protein [Planctomycetota bacterium]|nr:MotA/TolQ/ExbB proton channel family protein [Planctomycetota bacterium]